MNLKKLYSFKKHNTDPCKDPRCEGCAHIDGYLCPYPKECSAMIDIDKK